MEDEATLAAVPELRSHRKDRAKFAFDRSESMGGGKVKDVCAQRIDRALDLACSGSAEIWSAMPGHIQGRMLLDEKLKKAPPATVQRLCSSLAGCDGSDPKRDALAAYAVVEELDEGRPVEVRAIVDRLGSLPASEIRFRLAQRVQEMVGPAPNPPVPDYALADPLLVGASISGGDPWSKGSITCFVNDLETGQPMMLTCYHVLRPGRGFFEMQLGPGQYTYREGSADWVFQPSHDHSGEPVGTFVRGLRTTNVDAAVATIKRRKFANRTREGVNIRGTATVVRDGDPVWKRGAGGRVQRGMIQGVTGFATERSTWKQFTGQICANFNSGSPLFLPMHSDDDDGCPLFDARNNLIGIVVGIADTSGTLIVTPIGRVFDELGVTLATTT
jgi:hypothetical protein